MQKLMSLTWVFLFITIPLISICQERTITGTVKNDRGQPLPLASVQQKGTTNTVTANESGAFSIKVNGNNVTLVVSSVSHASRDIPIGSNTNYDVELKEGVNLSEVVVTALGISKEKKALRYATQEVKSSDLNQNRQSNLVNALQGKVAGVTISSIGGGPGQGATIRVRGINSIDVTQSNDPLFVIDGIILDNSTSTLGAGAASTSPYNVRTVGNRASDINPEDIETINILKGGAATALYGLRGANGVVVITTKKGKGDGVRVNVSSMYGFDQINKTPEIQKIYTAGILGVYTPIGLGPAWGPTIAEAKLIDATHPDELYDNYKQAYQTGKQRRNSINLTGGGEAVKFFSSVSYFDQEGMLPFTDYKNISARFNADVKISSVLKASFNTSFTNSGGYRYDADRFGESLAYFSGRWNVKDYLNPDGTQLWRGTNNPIYGAATNRLKDNVNRFIGGVALQYTPFPWLNFSYRFGGDTYTDNRFRTAPGLRGITGERSYDNSEGFVGDYNINYRALNSTFLATLSSKFGEDITATLRLGHELLDRKTTARGVLGSKLNVFDWFNLRNAAVLESSDNTSQYRLMGIFGEATIDYKTFLFLSVTGRNDITSSLLKPNNSFFYPSVSLSYLFSEHLKLPEYINYGKVRLSYAKIGKDALPYSTSTGYSAYVGNPSTGGLPSGITGFTRGANLGDPGLRPEFTNTIEGGLEMSFLNNRVSFDLTYYHSLSKDQIINVNVSSATGYVRAAINSGSMRNKGIELILKGTPVKTNNFTWDASLNFSANRNKVISIREGLTEITYGGPSGGYLNSPVTMKLIPGEAYGNIYGTVWQRYYGGGTKEDPVRTNKSLPMVIGANGFPVLAPVSTQKLLGNSQPDWIGGLVNNFTYKGFTLSTLIDARWGMERFNRLENFFAAFGIADYTADRRSYRVFEGVLADGTPNTKKVWLDQATGPDGVNYGEGYYRNYYRAISEPFVEDASWIRLRSASLSYSLPAKWLPKKFIRNASVTVTGNNLLLHTDYYGLDPESVSADSGSNVDGASGFTYPAARTVLFSINVGFYKKLIMHKYYKFLLVFLIAGSLVLQSCRKGYFDLNDNPNQVTIPSLSSLLSTATHKTGINNYNVGGVIAPYVQYTANPSASAASDIYQEVDFTSTWDALYFALADIHDLKVLAMEQGSSEYLGVANVLLSYHINLVSDLWGSAPYSDAFNPETLTPKYDSQEDLYKTALTLLDSAILQLGRTDAVLKLSTTNDLIHQGSRPKWLQTAYALRARMLIKVSKTASYNAASVLTAVDNAYKSNADDAGMASFQLRNPWAQVARNNASLTLGGWLSEQLIDQLNGTTYGTFDPRIRKITDPTVTSTWIGTVNGAGNRPPGNNTVKDENYIAISSPWTSDVAPVLIMTYAELKFIEAEAALVSNPARAYTAYLAGINANMDKLQVPAGAERTAYVTAASVGQASLTRALILKEKYVATYLNPEAWNDARRFDYQYKDFTLPVNAVLPTFIRRLAYPSGERSKNGMNIPAIGALSERLWWDK